MKKIFTLLVSSLMMGLSFAQPGSIDLTYTTGTGFDSYVFASEFQTDGKLVVVGGFSMYNGVSRSGIARLNTDGTLDMTFNPGTGFNNWVTGVKIQPDGKIITVGQYTSFNGTTRNRIARLNTDGTLDGTFNPGTAFNGLATSCDLQADGKIIAVGEFTTYNGTARSRVIRINTDGTIDASFDPGTGLNGNAQAVQIQADGKILIGARNVGGAFTSYNGTPMNRILRLNPDATIDGSFTIGTGCNSGVTSFAIQNDSKIIVGGAFTNYNGNAVNRIMRLNSDGTFDSSFGVGAGVNNDARDIQISSDGSVFVAGLFTTYNGTTVNRIVKLNSNGAIDANFNTGTSANNEINTIAIQSNNKVILGGFFTSFNGTLATRIVRLNNCLNTSATDYQTSCGDFIWIDGNTYSSNNNSATFVIPNAAGCDSLITLNLLVDPIVDQTVTAPVSTICDIGSVTISTGSSQNGVNYYLRDDSDNSIIDGPLVGTGTGIDFTTNVISSTTTYNVYSENIENSILFDGIDDEAVLGSPNFSGQSFTVEFWGRRNSISGSDFFVGQGTIGTNTGLHIGFRPSNQFTFAFFNNDINTPVYTDLDWHHWAMTYNATTNERKVYRDGIQVASDVATGDYIGSGPIYLGDLTWGGGNINGNMDELRIWNSNKNIVEIQSLMNTCLVGNETGLMAYYKLNETTGTTTVSDSSPNSFDGNLVNMDANNAWQDGIMNCTCTSEMTDLVTITVNNSNTGIDYQTACDSYTWIDGNTYSASTNSPTFTLTNVDACDSVVTLSLVILDVADETLTPAQTTFCDNGSTTITTGASQNNVEYYLRDDFDNAIIDGPLAGTGSGLVFNTNSISTTTTYNVYAQNLDNGITFDGVNDEIQVNGIDLNGASFTIEFWSKRNTTGSNQYYASQGITTTNLGLHIGYRNTDEFTIAFWSNDLSTPPYTDLNWHHWAVTYDAVTNARNIYRDGALIVSDVAATDYLGSGTFYLGNTAWSGGNANGNMDEFRIWDNARSITEIQDNMKECLTGSESGLMAYYKLDGQAGMSNAIDATPNGFDGTLVNMDAMTTWQTGVMSCTCATEMSSLVTITINNSNTGTDVQTACDSYTWIDGNTYSADNSSAQFTLTNTAGCDSVVTLNLTINQSNTGTDVQNVCESLTWIDGNTYTADNSTATFTLTNMDGCDSIVTLNLTVGAVVAAATNNGDGTLSATGTGTYQWIDCGTNTAVSGANSATFVPTVNGNYAVVVTSGACDDTSACVAYNSVGLNENSTATLTVYPNPTNGFITVNFGQELSDAYVVVTNVLGEQVYAENVSGSSKHELSLDQSTGIYFVNVYTQGNLVSTVRVIKQ